MNWLKRLLSPRVHDMPELESVRATNHELLARLNESRAECDGLRKELSGSRGAEAAAECRAARYAAECERYRFAIARAAQDAGLFTQPAIESTVS